MMTSFPASTVPAPSAALTDERPLRPNRQTSRRGVRRAHVLCRCAAALLLALPCVVQAQSASTATPRTDGNSMLAHEQLLAKARQGGVDLYFIGDSITRRWGATDYPAFLSHWNTSFFGWNAGNFAWGADSIQHILWRAENGELDGVDPKVIVILAGANNVGAVPLGDAQIADLVLGIERLVDTCRIKAPSATLILTALFPRGYNPPVMPTINGINAAIAALANGRSIRFLNINDRLADANGVLFPGITSDYVHLALPGYQVWADALRPILTELLGPPSATDHAPPPTGDPSVSRPNYTPSSRPPFVPRQTLAVAPGATAGRVVGTAQAIDSDGGPVGNWQITGGTGASLFAINANTGQLTAATGATVGGPSYTLEVMARNGFGPGAAGTVTVLVSDLPQKVLGCGYEIDADVHHPNGNIYDQISLTGPVTTIRADAAQIVRASYLDLNDDIVQIEFSGPGTVTISLADAVPPALPAKYNQAVSYVKGHATIAIMGADEFSNLSVFSVGRGNAVNQALFQDVAYDGVADLARVIIASPTQRFGGLRTANADYWATRGDTGVSAPGVRFSGPVNVHNLSAREQAVPVLLTGAIDPRVIDGTAIDGCVLVAGGDMAQVNNLAIRLGDAGTMYFRAGADSHNRALPAQPNRGVFRRNGQDVTAGIVRGP